jgi:hypothetical protein
MADFKAQMFSVPMSSELPEAPTPMEIVEVEVVVDRAQARRGQPPNKGQLSTSSNNLV